MAVAVLALAVAAASAGAADRTPDQLLKEYPLEQRPATVANAPAPARSDADEPRGDAPRVTQGAAIAIACAAMLLAGFVVVRRRPGAEVASSTAGTVASPAVVEHPAPVIEATAPVEEDPEPAVEATAPDEEHAEPAAEATPPVEDAEATTPVDEHPAPAIEATEPAVEATPASAPAEPVPPSPPPPIPLPARATRDGLLCQIRWECDGRTSWFAAVTTKDRAHETVADSADFPWNGTEPPPRTPDAQEALRDLIDELQIDGWQPVRGRGRQHGAPRWYARRFQLPALGPESHITNEPISSAEADIA
jgi:hypothetical protein